MIASHKTTKSQSYFFFHDQKKLQESRRIWKPIIYQL